MRNKMRRSNRDIRNSRRREKREKQYMKIQWWRIDQYLMQKFPVSRDTTEFLRRINKNYTKTHCCDTAEYQRQKS